MTRKNQISEKQLKEKPTPAYLREDYPYQAGGDAIENLDLLEPGAAYEIQCGKCQTSIRSQGKNIKRRYERLCVSGCICCGNKVFVVKRVYMKM